MSIEQKHFGDKNFKCHFCGRELHSKDIVGSMNEKMFCTKCLRENDSLRKAFSQAMKEEDEMKEKMDNRLFKNWSKKEQCKKCHKKIHYVHVCPYCGTLQ